MLFVYFILTIIIIPFHRIYVCGYDLNELGKVYCRGLRRLADPAGLDVYNKAMDDKGFTLKQVLVDAVNSDEYYDNFVSEQTEATATIGLYDALLARMPTPYELAQDREEVEKQGYKALVDKLTNSHEYSNAFGDWKVPGDGRKWCPVALAQFSNGMRAKRGHCIQLEGFGNSKVAQLYDCIRLCYRNWRCQSLDYTASTEKCVMYSFATLNDQSAYLYHSDDKECVHAEPLSVENENQ